MAVIREIDLKSKLDSNNSIDFPWSSVFDQILDAVRDAISDDMWRWYREHEELKIIKVKKWFLSYTFRVRHCRFLFELLFGDEVFL